MPCSRAAWCGTCPSLFISWNIDHVICGELHGVVEVGRKAEREVVSGRLRARGFQCLALVQDELEHRRIRRLDGAAADLAITLRCVRIPVKKSPPL